MSSVVDRMLILASSRMPFLWKRVAVIPVLHVEQLNDSSSFRRVMEFCTDYLDATGKRAVSTVITPSAPLLAAQLADAGFSDDDYASRLRELADVSDMGLHGHYVRGDKESSGPVHNYWPEQQIVIDQIAGELDWLERHGLGLGVPRAYAAGWWYLDDCVRKALVMNRFNYDFTPSRNRYNISQRVLAGEVGTGGMPEEVWAVSGICAARNGVSSVPRHLLRSSWRNQVSGARVVASLYSHDWDMEPSRARDTISTLLKLGVEFVDLQGLRSQGVA